MISIAEVLRIALMIGGSAGGAWLAVRVELKWLRADVTRHELVLNLVDRRLRAIENQRGAKPYVAND